MKRLALKSVQQPPKPVQASPSLASLFEFSPVKSLGHSGSFPLNSLSNSPSKTPSNELVNELVQLDNIPMELPSISAQYLYDSVMTPVSHSASLGPLKTIGTKLNPDYLSNLTMTLTPNRMALKRDSLKDSGTTLSNLSDLIHVNALAGRPNEAQVAFDAILENGLTPDTIAYNQLMNAYTSDLNQATRVFHELRSNGTPDLVSYSILINAYIKSGDLDGSFKLFSELKELNLEPNELVYTTLIKGCISANQIERAWSVFDNMRIKVCQPDGVAYNLMIHACSKTKDAERALDLFEEMRERNMNVDCVTFTSLLAACLSRRDYYHDAFPLLEQMNAQGLQLTSVTYLVLLKGIARYGDLERGRLIWNDYISEMISEEGPEYSRRVNGDIRAVSSILTLFSSYLSRCRSDPSLYLSTSLDPNLSVETSIEKEESTFIEKVECEKSSDDLIEEKQLEKSVDDFDLIMPDIKTPSEVIHWGKELYNYILTDAGSSTFNSKGSSQPLQDSYLRLLTNLQDTQESINTSIDFVKNLNGRSVFTFYTLLNLSARDPDLFKPHLDWLVQDFNSWYSQRESSVIPSSGIESSPLLQQEQELIRVAEKRGKDFIRPLFLSFIRSYASIGEVDKALETLETAQSFVYPYYLGTLQKHELPSLLAEIEKKTLSGDLTYQDRIHTACPDLALSELVKGKLALSRRVKPSSWWGWKVIGEQDGKESLGKGSDRTKNFKTSRQKVNTPQPRVRVFPGALNLHYDKK